MFCEAIRNEDHEDIWEPGRDGAKDGTWEPTCDRSWDGTRERAFGEASDGILEPNRIIIDGILETALEET